MASQSSSNALANLRLFLAARTPLEVSDRELLDRVTLMAFSEFGRRVQENASAGTDHGTAGPVLLAGGTVRGGLIGTAPRLLDLEDGDLKASLDFRRVYATLLKDWLGVAAESVLARRYEPLPLFRG